MRREIMVAAMAAFCSVATLPSAQALPVILYMATASDAVAAVQQLYPEAIILAVRRAPNGDFIVVIRLGNQLRRVRVDGETGTVK